jgi:hypothetical protein
MIVGGDQSVSIAVSVVNDFVNKVLANHKAEASSRQRTQQDVI